MGHQPSLHGHVKGWSFPHVMQLTSDHRFPPHVLFVSQRGGNGYIDGEPRSPFGGHSLKLPIHQIGLSANLLQCIGICFPRVFGLFSHKVNLSRHHERLSLQSGDVPVGERSGRSGALSSFDGLNLHYAGLPFNSAEGANRSSNPEEPNNYQQNSSPGGNLCGAYRPSIDTFSIVFFSLIFGGFGGSILMALCVNNQRRFLRSALICIGFGCAEGSVLFLIATGLFPHTWGLPPQWLPPKWKACQKSKGNQQVPHIENVSQKGLHRPCFVYYNKYMPNVLNADKQIAVISSLCEGSSIRSIERITGVHRDTIMRLGVKVGQGCTALMDAKMRNLECTRLEMDEIWGYVGKKEKHVRPGDDPQFGNVWTFCAIDADTKLVPAFHVASDRSEAAATAFVTDVADRLKNRVQISTDGLRAYVDAIELAFGKHNVDYGQIIKTYGTEESVEAQRRYSAPKITESEKKGIFGYPDWDFISTSYVERLNATTRLHMKRLARLTHAFSKKRENFEAAVGLHFAYYNFVRRHNTLRCTPAMAAGVEPSFWSVGDLVEACA
jgi:IS1 family transposase